MTKATLLGFDLGEKDESVEILKSGNEYFKICEDKDDECVSVKSKTKCYLYDPSKGICPYIINK